MIVINVVYNCKPGQRQNFYDAIQTQAEYFRKEEGNIQYAYFDAKEDDDKLVLIEKWADEAALAAHASTDIFKSLGAAKAEYVNETIIDKFEK